MDNYNIFLYYNMIIIFLLLFLLIIIYILNNFFIFNEGFEVYWSGPPVNNNNNNPYWNPKFGQTSNMSYDLRGDPLIIPKYPFMWNYSTLTPIYNRSI